MFIKACFLVLAVAAANDDSDTCAAVPGGCAGNNEADADTLIQSRVRISGGLAPELNAKDPLAPDLGDAGVDIQHMGLLQTYGSEPTEHVPGEEIGTLELDEEQYTKVAQVLTPTSATDQTPEASLVYGPVSSNACPGGSAAIADEATCLSVSNANDLDYYFAGKWSSLTVGCFKQVSGTKTFFNKHPTGNPQGHSRYVVVCQAKATCDSFTSCQITQANKGNTVHCSGVASSTCNAGTCCQDTTGGGGGGAWNPDDIETDTDLLVKLQHERALSLQADTSSMRH